MKRSPMKPGKPLAPGKGFAPRQAPMPRGISTLGQGKPLERSQGLLIRSSKPIRQRSKTNSDPRPKTGEAELCQGQPCYLAILGLCAGGTETTVPAHSNQARHGKGRGIKAHDVYTVPACWRCHAEIDSGKNFTREEKFALWDAAFARWEQDRCKITTVRQPTKN